VVVVAAALVVDARPPLALHADSATMTAATNDMRLTSHSLARPVGSVSSRR
jgi:hypothetical protein